VPEQQPNSTRGICIDGLAKLPEKALVNQKALASNLGVDPRTVRRMVQRFELPPPTRLSGRAVWMVGKVLRYIEDAMDAAEREAIKERERIRKL